MKLYAVVLRTGQHTFETRVYRAFCIEEAMWLADESPIGNYAISAYQVVDDTPAVN